MFSTVKLNQMNLECLGFKLPSFFFNTPSINASNTPLSVPVLPRTWRVMPQPFECSLAGRQGGRGAGARDGLAFQGWFWHVLTTRMCKDRKDVSYWCETDREWGNDPERSILIINDTPIPPFPSIPCWAPVRSLTMLSVMDVFHCCG